MRRNAPSLSAVADTIQGAVAHPARRAAAPFLRIPIHPAQRLARRHGGGPSPRPAAHRLSSLDARSRPLFQAVGHCG